MHVKKISYPDIVHAALGKRGKKILEVFLAVVHFQFTIAHISFMIQGLKSTVENLSGWKNLEVEYFGLIVLALFSPLAWIRKIEAFKIGFMFGFAMIIITVITISTFCISMNLGRTQTTSQYSLEERGFIPMNYDSYSSTIGFFFFLFEGIGGVMPIMGATKDRESFPKILCLALFSLCVMHCCFAELCYYTFGSSLNKAIIMEMMPSDNPII
jgi:amino acid permease